VVNASWGQVMEECKAGRSRTRVRSQGSSDSCSKAACEFNPRASSTLRSGYDVHLETAGRRTDTRGYAFKAQWLHLSAAVRNITFAGCQGPQSLHRCNTSSTQSGYFER
jgi:hypothetical protein